MAGKDQLVRSYAEALIHLADAEGELDAVERQLFAFTGLLESDTRVREALIDPSLPVENKRRLIADSLGERANALAVSMLGFIVEQGRARELARIVEELAEVAAATREHGVAEVRSAVPLDESRTKKLAEALSKATGREIEVRVVVDPRVVGGVVAKVGDEVFDGSVRSRLDEAREHLATTTTTRSE
ncbi:MAG TPA: ATP synthase F1 subunit delta [Actinomycetota bacterium]|nr:ATP synthase F1 subunit delta [Actinomycetota bacterium]